MIEGDFVKDKKIDFVIIGVNSEKTLARCIDSINASEYSIDLFKIYYVDGGSSDKSLEIASAYKNVEIIELILEYPTPGSQRNAGWKVGESEFVQFLDSDTILDKNWIKEALKEFENSEVGAVFGNRVELYPEKSIFNWIGDLEWGRGYSGESSYFGGDVLVKREALVKTNGYIDSLVAGEDPELGYRFRKNGFKIIKKDILMTEHDLAMYKFKQYWKRAYRTGHAYAEINDLHNDFWKVDILRIKVRGGLALLFLILGLSFGIINLYFLIFGLIGILLLLKPRLFLNKNLIKNKNLTLKEGKTYALHASLVVIPQFLGVVRFWYGKVFKNPLRNKRRKLNTGGIK